MRKIEFRYLPELFVLLAVVYAILIFALSSVPGEQVMEVQPDFPHADKVGHFFLYSGFGLILYLAFSRSRNERICGISRQLTLAVGFVYGITDEIHQYFTPGRDTDIVDLLVDTVAILTVLGIITSYNRWRTSE